MNLEQLKKNIGQHLRMVPIACRLDEFGEEPQRIDDDWLLQEVTTDYLMVQNIRTAHIIKLGKDHVHHYTSDPNRVQGNAKFGFLTLNVQIFIKGVNASIYPNSRPGEPVDPPIRKPLKDINLNASKDTSSVSAHVLLILD
jgi:hypothetical protein